MTFTIHQGDNRDILKTLEDNSIDAIVTDPPYGIDFLGKAWDANTGALETYRECLRVLKPGGYILAFSAARTYHHLAVTLEQAGFEIRDQLMWLYASGFPKAQDIGKAIDKRAGKYDAKYGTTTTQTQERGINTHGAKGMGSRKCNKCQKDVAHQYSCNDTECGMKYNYGSEESKQWAGWKTALKPAHEPIAMARKPFKGSTIDNVLTHGTGALNIDATRIGTDDVMISSQKSESVYDNFSPENRINKDGVRDGKDNELWRQNELGRFPSNVLGEVEGYQKFFYCPKVSRKERHIGYNDTSTNIPTIKSMIEDMGATLSGDGQTVSIPDLYDIKIHGLKHEYELWCQRNGKTNIPTEQSMLDDMGGYYCDSNGNRQENTGKVVKLAHLSGTIQIHGLKEEYRKWCEANGKTVDVGNNHPTVKPVELMKYLIKLVTPPNSTVLDPFTGSGSTGMAATELGHTFIGCELDPAYVEIAKTRIEAWNTIETDNVFKELFE